MALRNLDSARRPRGTHSFVILNAIALGSLALGASNTQAQTSGYTYVTQPTQYTYATAPASQPTYYYPAQAQQPAVQQVAPQQPQAYTTAAQPTAYAAPAQQPAAQPAAAAAPQPAAGDAYGFTNWLNGIRASYGLGAVGYDANLEAWANVNNGHQNARGIGHHVMGSARRQNCAMGNYASIGAMWLASPAHAAALLDPSITAIGIAGAGAYWTFNAY